MPEASLPTTRIPFQYVSGLETRTQYELRRNFEELAKAIVPSTSLNRGRYFIACSNSSAAEKAEADIVLDGSTDTTVLNTFFATTHVTEAAEVWFGTGQVNLTATLTVTQGWRLRGSSITAVAPPFYTNTIFNFTGAASGYTGGATAPIGVSISSIFNVEIAHIDIVMSGVTGFTRRVAFLCGGSSGSSQTFQNIQTTGVENFVTGGAGNIFCINCRAISGGTNFFAPVGGNTYSGCFINCGGTSYTLDQTFAPNNAMFIGCAMSSTTPVGSNGILPVTGAAPTGSAGGDLTGAYPGPTVAGVAAASLDIKIGTVGKGYYVKEGANASMGVATLVGGTVTVATTKVTANSRIQLTIQSPVGTPGAPYVSARVAGTSFTITSTSGTDASVVGWIIFEPS